MKRSKRAGRLCFRGASKAMPCETNPKVVGSSPASATIKELVKRPALFFCAAQSVLQSKIFCKALPTVGLHNIILYIIILSLLKSVEGI